MSKSFAPALEVRWYWGDVLIDTQHHLPADGPLSLTTSPRWTWRVLGVPLASGTSWVHRLLRFAPPILSDVEATAPVVSALDDDVVGGMTLFQWRGGQPVVQTLAEWQTTLEADGKSTELQAGEHVLSAEQCLTIHRGAIRVTAQVVDAPKGIMTRPSDEVDTPFVATLSFAGFVTGLAAILLYTAPAPASVQATTAFDTLHEHVVQLTLPPEPEEAEEVPAEEVEPEAAPESGAAKPEPEGQSGLADAPDEEAARTQVDRDTQQAMSAGVLAAWSAAGMDSLGENLMGGGLMNSIGAIDGPAGAARGPGWGRRGPGIGGGGQPEGLGSWGPRGNGPGGNPFGDGDGDCDTCMTRREGAISTMSTPMVIGHVDRSLISEVVQRHLAEIRYCYQRQLTRDPDLAGKVVVQFSITPQGEVSRATTKESTVGNVDVESCINGRFMRMQFPEIGTMAVVSYPFLFSSGG